MHMDTEYDKTTIGPLSEHTYTDKYAHTPAKFEFHNLVAGALVLCLELLVETFLG